MSILPSTTQPSTTVWQLSLDEPGKVVTDLDALQQSIRILLTTEPGSDVMRPDFGIGVLALIDEPIQNVAAILRQRGKAQFRDYMPEVEILGYSVDYAEAGSGKLTFTVRWKPVGGMATSTIVTV